MTDDGHTLMMVEPELLYCLPVTGMLMAECLPVFPFNKSHIPEVSKIIFIILEIQGAMCPSF